MIDGEESSAEDITLLLWSNKKPNHVNLIDLAKTAKWMALVI